MDATGFWDIIERVHEAALEDPNTLGRVRFDRKDPCYEGFQYAVTDALEARWGERTARKADFPWEPSGEAWNEDTVESLYPGLTYLGGGDEPPSPAKAKPWWKFW